MRLARRRRGELTEDLSSARCIPDAEYNGSWRVEHGRGEFHVVAGGNALFPEIYFYVFSNAFILKQSRLRDGGSSLVAARPRTTMCRGAIGQFPGHQTLIAAADQRGRGCDRVVSEPGIVTPVYLRQSDGTNTHTKQSCHFR